MFLGKTVLITGSGAGIGREAALRFAAQGAEVVVNSVSLSALAVKDEIITSGGKSCFLQADVSTAAGAKALVEYTIENYGKIDVLVNNAGIVPNGNVETTSEEEWDRSMDVNVKSVYLMSRFCVPYLRKTKGCIVNTASAVALKGVVNRAAYSAGKAAVVGLSRSMAREYVGDGIRINCVSPGTIVTPSLEARVQNTPNPAKTMQDFIARQPIGRLGTTAEVAEAIMYLAGDNAGYITGFNLLLDGGMNM